MSESIPNFIVVEGPIGVGKTSLARRFARSFGSELLLEGADENPFLERFYKKPREAALPTQLFFLFQRARQMQELRQADMFSPVRVSDFLIEKDRLFAELTLEDDEFELYEQVYENMTMDAPQPDLVIYLQAPVEVLLSRIAKRGHDYERNISAAYLQRLNDSYTQFFYQYTAAPLLIVNATELDFVNSTQDYDMLLERVKTVGSGRHFFNPEPFSF